MEEGSPLTVFSKNKNHAPPSRQPKKCFLLVSSKFGYKHNDCLNAEDFETSRSINENLQKQYLTW